MLSMQSAGSVTVHMPLMLLQQAPGKTEHGLGEQAVPGGSRVPPVPLQLMTELSRQESVMGSQQAVAHVVGVQTVPPPWNA